LDRDGHAAAQAAGREPAPVRALCEWARALCAYGSAARDAAPRRARLAGAERALAARRADAAAAQAALAGALAAVAALRARARRATRQGFLFMKRRRAAEACAGPRMNPAPGRQEECQGGVQRKRALEAELADLEARLVGACARLQRRPRPPGQLGSQ